MRLVALVPHFAPDVAPTGEVATRIVTELGRAGHTIEVVTTMPHYRRNRVEEGFGGRLVRHEDTPWGEVTRLHPFPARNKTNLAARALSFAGFSALATVHGARGPRADGVLAMSPPLTLGLSGWAVARARRAPLVFNIQDVYPDVAIELGYLRDPRVVAAARRLERLCYAAADAVTVLSEDLAAVLAPRVGDPSKIEVVPNFVDTSFIRPLPADNRYRAEHGLTGKLVVMYAGNVGLSQPLELMLKAAAAFSTDPRVAFVINGSGAARDELRRRAAGLANVVFVDMQPAGRLPEVLAAADVHVVLLRRGLSRASVPSKTYSILAAGRPLVASVDEGSEVARVVEQAGAGLSVPPEDADAFVGALRSLLSDPGRRESMGRAGRAWAESWLSPAAVAARYASLFERLRDRRTARAS